MLFNFDKWQFSELRNRRKAVVRKQQEKQDKVS